MSAKPVLYVCNVDENSAAEGNQHSDAVKSSVGEENMVVASAAIEAEAAQLSPEEEADFLGEMGLETAGLERIARKCMDLLNLSVFYSCGPEMCSAWLYPTGGTAEKCAGIIHSDIANSFHRAQIIRPEVVLAHKNEEEVIKLR